MRDKHVPNVLSPFEAPYATHEERVEFAAGLRAMADWIEETRFPIPALSLNRPDYYEATVDVPSVWIDDESFVGRPGSAARLIGGRVDKGTITYGTDFKLERDFGGGVMFRYRISRDTVCEAHEEVVEEDRYVPIDEATASEIEAQIEELKKKASDLPREVRTVSVVRKTYDCPPSLLAKVKADIEEPVVIEENVPF